MKLAVALAIAALGLLFVGSMRFGRPCGGPCDVSWVEVAFLAGLMLAGSPLVRIVFVISRRLSGSVPVGPSRVLVATGSSLVLVTALLTAYTIGELEKHAWPTVVVGNQGTHPSDPFYLAGDYAFTWRAISGATGCELRGTLHDANGSVAVRELVATSIPPNTNTGGPTVALDDVPRGGYYLDGRSNRSSWSLMLEPRRR